MAEINAAQLAKQSAHKVYNGGSVCSCVQDQDEVEQQTR